MLKKFLVIAIFCSTAMADTTTPDTSTSQTTPANPTTTTTTTTTTTNTTADSALTVTNDALTGIPGGYNNIDVKDQRVQDAAKFAVTQIDKGTLVSIDSAQMQVVAGINYALQLTMQQNGTNYRYKVVVFDPLPDSGQERQVTNIQSLGQAF